MALPEGLNRRYASIAAVVLVVVWLWVAFDRPYSFPKHVPWSIYGNTPLEEEGKTGKIIDTFSDPMVVSQAIKNMCEGTQWNDKELVVQCDNGEGNVANVRTHILTCVRYAIKAGATLVLPRFINPNGIHEAGAVVADWNRQQFDWMFDTDHFLKSMQASCPEMGIYGDRDKIPFPNNFVRPPRVSIVPEHIGQMDGEDWRVAFYKIVEHMISPLEDTYPIIIEMARPAPVYDVYSDGKQFAYDFGNLVRPNPTVRDLANKCILNLGAAYNVTFDLTQPFIRGAFTGAHLYTEEPDMGAEQGWPAVDWEYTRYEPQANNIFHALEDSKTSIIYLGSNRADEIAKFNTDAVAKGYNVHTKYSLLKGNDKYLLDDMTKDQQDMVDLLVMMKATYFAGIGHSAISWNVALKRHTWANEALEFKVGSHTFEDELSHIYGKVDEEKSLYHSMWP